MKFLKKVVVGLTFIREKKFYFVENSGIKEVAILF